MKQWKPVETVKTVETVETVQNHQGQGTASRSRNNEAVETVQNQKQLRASRPRKPASQLPLCEAPPSWRKMRHTGVPGIDRWCLRLRGLHSLAA